MRALEFYSLLFNGEVMVLSSIFAFAFFPPAGHGALDSMSALLIALLFVGVGPYFVYLWSVKKGKADFALSTKEMRNEFYPKIIPFFLMATIAFWFFDDRSMLALSFAWGMLFSILFVANKFTKVSIHTSGTAAVITAFALAYGPVFWLLLPIVSVVGLIRVNLKAHDFVQVVLGTLLGTAAFYSVFSFVL